MQGGGWPPAGTPSPSAWRSSKQLPCLWRPGIGRGGWSGRRSGRCAVHGVPRCARRDGQFVSALVRAQCVGKKRAKPDHGKGRLVTTPACRPVQGCASNRLQPARPRRARRGSLVTPSHRHLRASRKQRHPSRQSPKGRPLTPRRIRCRTASRATSRSPQPTFRPRSRDCPS